MPILLTAVESFPVYESDGTSHDEDFGTIQFTSDGGQILGQLRVFMADLDLGGMSVADVTAAVEAAGAQEVGVSITITDYITLEFGSFAISGQDVGLKNHSRMTAGVGIFTVTGQSVTLT